MATNHATPSCCHKCKGNRIFEGTRNVGRLSGFPGSSRDLTTKEWGAIDKPDEKVRLDTTKDEGKAINAAIIARAVTILDEAK